MKLENQVCTLKQSVKLFNYGLIDCQFNHACTKSGEYLGIDHFTVFDADNIYTPAFTVAELGVMLPSNIAVAKIIYTIHIGKTREPLAGNCKFECGYIEITETLSGKFHVIRNGDVLAHVLPDLLIYCLENNLTTPEEVNQILNNA